MLRRVEEIVHDDGTVETIEVYYKSQAAIDAYRARAAAGQRGVWRWRCGCGCVVVAARLWLCVRIGCGARALWMTRMYVCSLCACYVCVISVLYLLHRCRSLSYLFIIFVTSLWHLRVISVLRT